MTHRPTYAIEDVVILNDGRIGIVKGIGKVTAPGFQPPMFVMVGPHKVFVVRNPRGMRKVGLLEQIALAAANRMLRDGYADWKLPDDFKPW